MNFSYLTGEVGKLGIARIKRRIVVGNNALVYDTFTGTDGTSLPAHTPDICPVGSVWTPWAGGNMQIIGNQAIGGNRPYNDDYSDVINSGLADCKIIVDFIYGSLFYLPFRYNAALNAGYWAQINASQMILYETPATARAAVLKSLTTGQAYKVTIVLSGNSMSVTIDAATMSYSSAVNATNTWHGFGAQRAPAADTTIFDNYLVESL